MVKVISSFIETPTVPDPTSHRHQNSMNRSRSKTHKQQAVDNDDANKNKWPQERFGQNTPPSSAKRRCQTSYDSPARANIICATMSSKLVPPPLILVRPKVPQSEIAKIPPLSLPPAFTAVGRSQRHDAISPVSAADSTP